MTKTKSSKSAQAKAKPSIHFKDVAFDGLKHALLKAGEVKLSGVAMEGDPHVQRLLETWQIQQGEYRSDYEFRFGLTLNRSTYLFFEDPSDGYRSYLGTVLRVSGFRLHNRFTPLLVNVADTVNGSNERDHHSDSFQLLCRRTGNLIAEVGTDNYDDYYPSCIAFFDPQVLEVSQLDNLPKASSTRQKLRL